MYCWKQLRAFAAAQDCTGYFQWNISELTNPPEGGSTTETDDSTIVMDKNGKKIREVTMTNNVDLLLKEFADDNPVLKTTFYFNLKNGVDPGLLEFTIMGMDELIRDGKLQYNNYINDIAQYIGYVSDENGTASQKFLDEYANQEGVIYWNAVQLYNAHAISQVNAEQEKNKMARGIKRADYFIEVTKPDSVKWSDIMVVNSNGDRVQIVEKEINGRTGYGFYDFQGAGDRKTGESYSCVYRVGVLNDTIRESEDSIEINLTGYYLVTYQDTTSPVDYTDTAAHTLSMEDEQPVGTDDYMNKYNTYEINNGSKRNRCKGLR